MRFLKMPDLPLLFIKLHRGKRICYFVGHDIISYKIRNRFIREKL